MENILQYANFNQKLNDFTNMKLSLLMYGTTVGEALEFRNHCLSGSQFMKILNTIMDQAKTVKYSTLIDASELKLYKVDYINYLTNKLTDPTKARKLVEDIFDYNNEMKIDMPIFKLFGDKNYTFYEDYGYIPININVNRIEFGEVVEDIKNIYYIDDSVEIEIHPESYHIMNQTVEGEGEGEENKVKLGIYLQNLNEFRKMVKGFPVNLKLLQEEDDNLYDSSDEEEEEIYKELLLNDLRSLSDYDTEKILVKNIIKKFNVFRENYNYLIGHGIVQVVEEYFNTLKSFLIIPNHNFFINSHKLFEFDKLLGTELEFLDFINHYFIFCTHKLQKNHELKDIKLEFLKIIMSIPHDKDFYKNTNWLIKKVIKQDKTPPLQNGNPFGNTPPKYLKALELILKNRTWFLEGEIEKIKDYYDANKNQENTKILLSFLYNSSNHSTYDNEYEFKVLVDRLKLKDDFSNFQEVNYAISGIVNLLKNTTEDYIISTGLFCQCIVGLWKITQGFNRSETKDENYVNLCIRVFNIFFNEEHEDYCIEFFCLDDIWSTKFEELSYLIKSINSYNIKFRNEDINTEWGKHNEVLSADDFNNLVVGEKEKLILEGKFLHYRIYKTENIAEDINCFTVKFTPRSEPISIGGGGIGGSGVGSGDGGNSGLKPVEQYGGAGFVHTLNGLSFSGWSKVIKENSVTIARKFFKTDGVKEGLSVKENIKGQTETTNIAPIISEVDIKIKNQVTNELKLGEKQLDNIDMETFHKIFKNLYSKYDYKKDCFKKNRGFKSLVKSELVTEYLRKNIEIYLKQVLKKANPKKIKFIEFLKREYSLK